MPAALPLPLVVPSLSSSIVASSSLNLIDSLVRAAERDRLTPADFFQALVDSRIITAEEWAQGGVLSNLQALTQRTATFGILDHLDINTHACLSITSQPGPVFVANAHSPSGSFKIELLPHPLMPAQALKTWKVGPLKVTLLNDSEDEAKLNSKKRGRPNKTPIKPGKRKGTTASLQKDYPFDKLEIIITDLSFPASGCRPMRLEFSCSIMDPLNRVATFSVVSNSFMIISNCNQWKDGLGICLRNFIFPATSTQAPFSRFFNYLHLAYLDSKGFVEARYLDPTEIRNWLADSTQNELRLDRDRQLLEVHDTVTMDLFESWFEIAGPVLYDLHTSNVGKLFQRLWAAGFVGIGAHRSVNLADGSGEPGYCRLNINTLQGDDKPYESYLVLKTKEKSYALLALERDHLAYFFEHSRNSQGCTHLLSATDPNNVLPIEEIYAPKGAVSTSGFLSSSQKSSRR